MSYQTRHALNKYQLRRKHSPRVQSQCRSSPSREIAIMVEGNKFWVVILRSCHHRRSVRTPLGRNHRDASMKKEKAISCFGCHDVTRELLESGQRREADGVQHSRPICSTSYPSLKAFLTKRGRMGVIIGMIVCKTEIRCQARCKAWRRH